MNLDQYFEQCPRYMVVQEVWPRNPSKPMWLRVHSREQKTILSTMAWMEHCYQAELRKWSHNKRILKRIKKEHFYVVEIHRDENKMYQRVRDENTAMQQALQNERDIA